MKFALVSAMLLMFSCGVLGQVKQRRTELNRMVPPATRLTGSQQDAASKLFDRIAKAIEEPSVSDISSLFDRTVHLSLPGVEQGQFSKAQATQLLAAYLRTTRSLSVDIKKKEDSLASPYLSALLHLQQGDRDRQLSLYVSLIRSDASWKIGHFSVY